MDAIDFVMFIVKLKKWMPDCEQTTRGQSYKSPTI